MFSTQEMENAALMYVCSLVPSSHVSVALLFSISHFSSEMLALRVVWCESGPSLHVSWGATLSVSSFALLPRLKGPGRDGPKLTGFSLRSRPVLPRLAETYKIRQMKRWLTFIHLNSTFVSHLLGTFPVGVWNRNQSFGLEVGWAETWTTVVLNNGSGCYWQSVLTLEIWECNVYIYVICKTVI